MKEFKFSTEDPILVFEVLTCLDQEGDALDMNEGQVMVCLPHVLNNTEPRQISFTFKCKPYQCTRILARNRAMFPRHVRY